jgi:dCMP deaminase
MGRTVMTTRISRDAYGLKLAEAAALRADCTRRQVGAVIVAEDGSVVATGYNGLPSGRPGCASAGACPRGQMAYPSEPPVRLGEYVELALEHHCDERSPEERWFCTAHVDGWHVATGSCQVLAAWPDAPAHPASVDYEATGCRAVHAEINAIIRAGRARCVGATLFVTDEPCFHCSVVIEGAGIARVVTPKSTFPQGDLTEAYRILADATAPLPSSAAGAPTDRLFGDGDVVGAIRAVHGRRTSGPLDPEIHAALVRSVERGREEMQAAMEGPQ